MYRDVINGKLLIIGCLFIHRKFTKQWIIPGNKSFERKNKKIKLLHKIQLKNDVVLLLFVALLLFCEYKSCQSDWKIVVALELTYKPQ